jgi:5'-methylthioadenosine phosphorylase
MVINNLNANADNAKKLIKKILMSLNGERSCPCREAVKYAVITAPEKRDSAQCEKLRAILPQYF